MLFRSMCNPAVHMRYPNVLNDECIHHQDKYIVKHSQLFHHGLGFSHPKLLLFVWKLLIRALPTGDILLHHHLYKLHILLCSYGYGFSETMWHVFLKFLRAREIWWGFPIIQKLAYRDTSRLHKDNLGYIIKKIILLIIAQPMYTRNQQIHQVASTNPTMDIRQFFFELNIRQLIIAFI